VLVRYLIYWSIVILAKIWYWYFVLSQYSVYISNFDTTDLLKLSLFNIIDQFDTINLFDTFNIVNPLNNYVVATWQCTSFTRFTARTGHRNSSLWHHGCLLAETHWMAWVYLRKCMEITKLASFIGHKMLQTVLEIIKCFYLWTIMQLIYFSLVIIKMQINGYNLCDICVRKWRLCNWYLFSHVHFLHLSLTAMNVMLINSHWGIDQIY